MKLIIIRNKDDNIFISESINSLNNIVNNNKKDKQITTNNLFSIFILNILLKIIYINFILFN